MPVSGLGRDWDELRAAVHEELHSDGDEAMLRQQLAALDSWVSDRGWLPTGYSLDDAEADHTTEAIRCA